MGDLRESAFGVICAHFQNITTVLKYKQTILELDAKNVRVFGRKEGAAQRKIRLFSAFRRQKTTCVISLILAKKVLTNRDTICYNVQAVREQGSKDPSEKAAGEP